MKLKLLKAAGTLLSLVAVGSAQAEEIEEFWLTATTSSIELSDSLSTASSTELRSPGSGTISYVRFTQKFQTKLSNGWELGTNPVLENSKNGNQWNHTVRLDLELNPAKFNLGENGPSISMRNRWELRWKEGQGSEIFHRIRQQTKATWKIGKGPLTSYSVANEIFFEEDKGKITTNRFYPLMLGTKPSDKLKATYFLLYQSKRTGTTSDWSGGYYLGASLSL